MKSMPDSMLKIVEQLIERAEVELEQALGELDTEAPVGPRDREGNPALYGLPISYGCLGHKVEKLPDLSLMLRQARRLLEEPTGLIGGSERSQDGMKRAGLVSLLAQEAILAMGAARGQEPAVRDGFSYNGPVAGERVRSLGIRLLDGRLAGLALISGTAGSSEVAVRLVHQFHSKGLLLFLSGEDLIKQLAGEVEWGYDSGIIPLGPDVNSLAYAFGFVTAFALHFGKVEPGDFQELAQYNRSNLHVFHLSLGPLDEHGLTALAGSIACGFPVVTDVDSPWADFTPSGLFSFPFDRLSGEDDLQKAETLADRCLDLGGIKGIVPPTPAIPVEYGTEFEGETISADDLQVEFKGFEWLNMRDMAEVKDADIKVVGPEIEETGPEVPMGLLVEIAGRRMKKEFEAVLERRILHLISGAEGVQYEGQRDRMRIRFSKKAVQKGLRLEHLGHILYTGLHTQFDAIVDKIQVVIYTEEDRLSQLREQARAAYRERDSRVAGMREEDVDTFYSCLSCQSLTPYHLCIITPQKPGICGAVNFLDCQASYEINPIGPNQPVVKEGCLDPIKGEWESINRYVYDHSQMKFSRFCLHSILDDPPSVFNLCECLTVLVPEAGGVMVVEREDSSVTPMGMTFSELLAMAAATQTPGIIGHARSYLVSDKYLAGEGGIKRVVWMSRHLKEELAEELEAASERAGVPDLIDKIGGGDTCADSDGLLAFLEERGHPALTMDPMI
ncbi:hypothetical protein M1N20_01385 [Dehalococcoidia bacterium]|nr:hypothetical protein [Dehalococcoidia bacterium]